MSQSAFYWKPVIVAWMAVTVAQMGVGLMLPALPAISADLSISNADTQWYISAYLLGFGTSQLIYGPLSDALGRRPVLLSGLTIALLGALTCALNTESAELILLGRLLQGIGAGSASVLSRAMIRDCYNGPQLTLAISYVGIAAAFTPMLAPFLGGLISHHLGWAFLFSLMAGYICLITFVLFFQFAETRHGEPQPFTPASVVGGYIKLLGDRYFLGYAGINWLFFTAAILTASVMPFLLQQEVGLDASEYGRWSLVPAFFTMVGSFSANKLRHRLNEQQRLQIAFGILGCAALMYLTAPLNLYWLIASHCLFTMAFGIGFMISLSCLLQPYSQNAGAVSALSGCIQMLMASLGSAAMIKMGINTPTSVGAVLLIAVGCCVMLHHIGRYANQRAIPEDNGFTHLSCQSRAD